MTLASRVLQNSRISAFRSCIPPSPQLLRSPSALASPRHLHGTTSLRSRIERWSTEDEDPVPAELNPQWSDSKGAEEGKHTVDRRNASGYSESRSQLGSAEPVEHIDNMAFSKEILLHMRHPSIPDLELGLTTDAVVVTCPSRGIEKPVAIDQVWLRDACQEIGTSLQAGTKQKLVGTTDIPLVEGSMLHESEAPFIEPSQSGQGYDLTLPFSLKFPVFNAFSQTFSPVPQEPPTKLHRARIPLDLLLAHASKQGYLDLHHDPFGAAKPWGANDLASFSPSKEPPANRDSVQPERVARQILSARPARLDYATLVDEAPKPDLARWAISKGLVEDGLAFVTGIPTDVKGSELGPGPNSAELARLASMFGEIRNTFYGPLWDVRSLPSAVSKNIAYTNVDLGLHMDLLYFQNPPRFQFLHMLRNHVKGGQSIFVDSFKVAEHIWNTDSEAWDLLTKVPIAYHYQNDGRHYYFRHPLFERPHGNEGAMGPSFSTTPSKPPRRSSVNPNQQPMPRLLAVNYSPPFQAPFTIHSSLLNTRKKRHQFYKAFKLFADLTLQPEFRYERQLNKGECVIFDNRRVLHSRKGFEFLDDGTGVAEEQSKVKRWLKGCYVDGDAIWSSYRTLAAKHKHQK